MLDFRPHHVVYVLALGLAACDTSGPVLIPDAGPDAPPPPDAPPLPDAGLDAAPPPDETPPTVTSTRPRAGAIDVAASAALELRFSEPMDAEAGTLVATAGATTIDLQAGTWSDDGDVLTVLPATTWPSASRVDVVATAFEDRAGNPLEAPFALVFHVADVGAPAVVSTVPAEGATGVEVSIAEIVVTFSEPMNPLVGTVDAGPGVVLGARSWAGDTELHVAIVSAEPGAMARVALAGFQDLAANVLDGVPVLVDGALDFELVPDTTRPTLIDASPMDGQLDVDVVALTEVLLRFDEPMDRSVRTADFSDGTATTTRTGNWSEDGLELTFAVAGALAVDAEHTIDLSPLRDRFGNTLDPDVGLTGGVLTFTTSAADAALPFVVFTTPREGETSFSTRSADLVVVFSEAMDTSVVTFPLTGGTDTRTLTGTYNPGGTRLTLPIATPLSPSTDYVLDLAAARDSSGNALEPAHPYLGDQTLDFRTSVPSGEDCADPLTAAEASLEGGALVWTIPGGAFATADGLPSCSVSTTVAAGVIEIEKTSGTVASGGRALRITATSVDPFNGVQMEIRDGICDPADDGGTSRRLACLTQRQVWTQYLDAPAGTYYLWVSNENTGRFEGATIRVEEVPAVPEGESCGAPFTTASAIHTSPATGTHVWRLPHDGGTSSDQGTSTRGAGALSCVSAHGPDEVVRVEKTSATSILDVTIDPFPTDTILDRHGVYVEARSSCEGGPDAVLECTSRLTSLRTFQLDGPVGPQWLWLASANTDAPLPRVTVTVREVEPAPGESCATAIPIATGTTVPVTPASPMRFFAPSCAATGNVTWYRYSATRELGLVRTTGAAPLALVRAGTGDELACVPNGAAFATPLRAAVGTDVCIAVPSGSTVTAITVDERDWQGIVGTPTDLAIARPVDGAGVPVAITSEAFLAVTPTQLYLGIQTNSTSTTTTAPALVVAPRAGHENATRVVVDRFALGLSAATIGESLFTVEETARTNRLFRLVDAGGAITPAGTVWDGGTLYTTLVVRAMGLVAGESTFLLANAGSTTAATAFYAGSSTTPGALTRPGDNTALRDVVAIAANASWIFVLGNVPVGTTAHRSVYRIPRATPTAVPEPLAPDTELSLSSTNGSMVYDPTTDILYFRTTSTPTAVHAIWGASTATPTWAGPVVTRGRGGDHGLAIDASVPALFLFETETSTDGAFAEIR